MNIYVYVHLHIGGVLPSSGLSITGTPPSLLSVWYMVYVGIVVLQSSDKGTTDFMFCHCQTFLCPHPQPILSKPAVPCYFLFCF